MQLGDQLQAAEDAVRDKKLENLSLRRTTLSSQLGDVFMNSSDEKENNGQSQLQKSHVTSIDVNTQEDSAASQKLSIAKTSVNIEERPETKQTTESKPDNNDGTESKEGAVGPPIVEDHFDSTRPTEEDEVRFGEYLTSLDDVPNGGDDKIRGKRSTS